jgi:hypothetical protein
MSTDEILGGGRSPGGVSTAPHPADTQAAKRLGTRVLVIASGEAEATAQHIDPVVSGLVIAGATAPSTLRTLRRTTRIS